MRMLDDRPLLQRYHTRGMDPLLLYCDVCTTSSCMIYRSEGLGAQLDRHAMWFGVIGMSWC